jgi:2-oxoglutarate dehydrogenase E1 component
MSNITSAMKRILKGAFGGQIKTSLAPNPSHLEFVNPVVAGIARGKQDAFYNRERGATLPIVIHGDSAMIGQGVVTETLQLARVDGYTCGGTIHIVVNNQIGFTLDPKDSRSSPYSTEWCKAIEAPIFHVNAEDPDAAAWAILLSAEFRQQFKRDAVVDLYCYRKYGHNEADDPSFTQPVIYSEIRQKKNISVGYAERLIADNSISQAEVDQMRAGFSKRFDDAYATRKPPTYGDGCSLIGKLSATPKTTGIENEALKQIVHTLVQYPEGFTPHPKLAKILEKRVELVEQGEGLDWAICEALSFGSLVLEGFAVRLSGQDCGRGTFSQRHLALRDYNTGTAFYPLQLLSQAAPGSPTFEVYNSVLSETGVMGFEFGYSSVHKGALVLWEAQFGDFANGAQVIIDQFISSSEAKWNQLSGLVLLLPHGYEGQGPEHSSARLERYLQLAADGNMSVCYPSNGAQYFHLLRRQALNPLRRPLIVMTPKSLLRNPEATVSVGDLEKGVFKPVIEEKLSETTKAKRIVFVTGKIFYDVRAAIREKKVGDVSIVRIEELYPFAKDELKAILKRHGAKKLAWVQEEPQNMGAWSFIDPLFRSELGVDLTYFGRPPSASTATGSGKRHAKEQKLFLDNLVDFLQK